MTTEPKSKREPREWWLLFDVDGTVTCWTDGHHAQLACLNTDELVHVREVLKDGDGNET